MRNERVDRTIFWSLWAVTMVVIVGVLFVVTARDGEVAAQLGKGVGVIVQSLVDLARR